MVPFLTVFISQCQVLISVCAHSWDVYKLCHSAPRPLQPGRLCSCCALSFCRWLCRAITVSLTGCGLDSSLPLEQPKMCHAHQLSWHVCQSEPKNTPICLTRLCCSLEPPVWGLLLSADLFPTLRMYNEEVFYLGEKVFLSSPPPFNLTSYSLLKALCSDLYHKMRVVFMWLWWLVSFCALVETPTSGLTLKMQMPVWS